MAQYFAGDHTGGDGRDLSKISARVLTATHPLYDENIEGWVRALDLYEGDNLSRYIHRHARESLSSHAQRCERLHYRNYCASILDLYLQYIFSKPAVRSFTPVTTKAQSDSESTAPSKLPGIGGEWQDWQTNVDRKGTKAEGFYKDQARWALTFGHVFVLVDMPSTKRTPKTEAERKTMKLRPYVSSYFPSECTKWALDEDNKPLWIRFREQIPDVEDPFLEKQSNSKPSPGVADPQLVPKQRRANTLSSARYRTWTRKEWVLHEVTNNNVKEIDRGPNPLGEVPVVPFYNRRTSRNPFLGESRLKDIGRVNQAILNLDSLIDEAIYQQTLNILVMGRSVSEEEEIVLGTNNVMEYSGDRPPYFMSPSTAPIMFMEDRIQRLQQEIYRMAKMNGSGTQPQSYPSGVSMSLGFNETSAMLAEHADEWEQSELEVNRLWMKWMGAEFKGTIDYPNEFDTSSFMEDLDLVTKAKAAPLRSPTLVRHLEKRLVRKILKTGGPEMLAEIEKEIDFIPEYISTFTGPIYFDQLRQTVNNPQPTGAPVGAYGDIVREQGIQTEEQAKAQADAEQQQQDQAQQFGQQQVTQQQTFQHQKDLAKTKQPPTPPVKAPVKKTGTKK